jgi:hypothetical protein
MVESNRGAVVIESNKHRRVAIRKKQLSDAGSAHASLRLNMILKVTGVISIAFCILAGSFIAVMSIVGMVKRTQFSSFISRVVRLWC